MPDVGGEQKNMARVLIADDHPIVRGGLKELLVRQLENVVFGEAANADETLAQVHRQPWDLVILDINMPGRSGYDILSDIRQAQPKLPILVLSMYPEEQYGKRVIQAGARGYLKKGSAPEDTNRPSGNFGSATRGLRKLEWPLTRSASLVGESEKAEPSGRHWEVPSEPPSLSRPKRQAFLASIGQFEGCWWSRCQPEGRENS
jgi:CheY-like chemotaxis protein